MILDTLVKGFNSFISSHDSLFKNLHISMILLIVIVLSIVVVVREDFLDILDNNSVTSECKSCSGH